MAHILKNNNLKVTIDLPHENYDFSRFDWTGKITSVEFQNMEVAGVEHIDVENENAFGKGFYNEFGIDNALGFHETEIGNWFHKIGVGLLKKEDNNYLFHKKYKIKPAKFDIKTDINSIEITCTSQFVNGFAYILKKEIKLLDSSFVISYYLKNTGEKAINTTEYVHNFTTINKHLIGSNYILKFPFLLKPLLFEETVNPEQKVSIKTHKIKFNGSPKEQFFFSNLSGGNNVPAKWELQHLKSNIGISETASFNTNKVNLWGWKHVLSPELFFTISLKTGQATTWHRTYNFFNLS